MNSNDDLSHEVLSREQLAGQQARINVRVNTCSDPYSIYVWGRKYCKRGESRLRAIRRKIADMDREDVFLKLVEEKREYTSSIISLVASSALELEYSKSLGTVEFPPSVVRGFVENFLLAWHELGEAGLVFSRPLKLGDIVKDVQGNPRVAAHLIIRPRMRRSRCPKETLSVRCGNMCTLVNLVSLHTRVDTPADVKIYEHLLRSLRDVRDNVINRGS